MATEDEMLELARSIPADLLDVGTSDRVLTLLDAALAELDRRLECSRRLALGQLARGDVPDIPFDTSARYLLQAARWELHLLSIKHAAVGRVFAVARARIGARRHPELLEAYEARRHDAFFLAKRSLDRLLDAAGYADAAAEAFDVARSLPYASPLWSGWTKAAEDMARSAHAHAVDALDALDGMQGEVCLEYFSALTLLHALRRDQWVKTARDVPLTVHRVATFLPAVVADSKPSDMVAAALGDLTEVLALHREAGRDLESVARHLGLRRGDLWERWSTRHGEVASAGQDAAKSLESAKKTLQQIDRAVGKPPRHLVLCAGEQLRSGRDALSRLRSAATLEFFDSAWLTLKNLSD